MGSEFAVRMLVRADVEATDRLPNSCRRQSEVELMSERLKQQVGGELSLRKSMISPDHAHNPPITFGPHHRVGNTYEPALERSGTLWASGAQTPTILTTTLEKVCQLQRGLYAFAVTT